MALEDPTFPRHQAFLRCQTNSESEYSKTCFGLERIHSVALHFRYQIVHHGNQTMKGLQELEPPFTYPQLLTTEQVCHPFFFPRVADTNIIHSTRTTITAPISRLCISRSFASQKKNCK